MCERDASAAQQALANLGNNTFGDNAVRFSAAFGEGLLARMTHDEGKAHAAFAIAREQQEKVVTEQPDYGPTLCVLGVIDAGLGRKEEALSEGRRAVELMPVSKDAINGPLLEEFLAVIAAWTGEKDLAIKELTLAGRVPTAVSYGYLKLHPFWDPLRGDPQFEKVVISLAPKLP
jgi:serine/threonine-protein kinase